MPFRKYSSYFLSDELHAFATAFEAAWQQLRASGTTRDQDAVIKKNLTQIILASACKGEREIEQLKDIALRALSQRAAIGALGPFKSTRARCNTRPGGKETPVTITPRAMGHERTFHTLIRHVRFSAGTRLATRSAVRPLGVNC